MSYAADRNLLFGILALQLDFITRNQLVAGMQAWVNEKAVPLDELLVRAGALGEDRRKLLLPLVDEHIRQHGNDPQRSLATMSSAEGLKHDLRQVNDADLQQTLAGLPLEKPRDPNTTITFGGPSQIGVRFRILRTHAEGGLGQVFVARDEELGREVALKEIKLQYSQDLDSQSRFLREAEITGGLEHPSIVPVYGLGKYPDGRPFYAMRFIQGSSLKDAIANFHGHRFAHEAERNMALRKLLQRFLDVCDAMEYAHSRGVLHRDLKPGNIMLGRFGETLVVDWGLAKVKSSFDDSDGRPLDREGTLRPRSGDSSATQMGSTLGTPAYMPPEQALGRLDALGPQSDVYSLGATLYCLLVGKPPVEGTNSTEVLANVVAGRITPPRQRDRKISRPIEAICLKALSREPGDRYVTVRQLADDLEKWLADEPITALPEELSARLTRLMRRNRQWVQAGISALVLVTFSVLGAYFYQRQTAAENLQLANEKSTLAEEKAQLATLEKDARELAEAKNASLRETLAANYFARGVNEYAAGRVDTGTNEIFRAWALIPDDHPLKVSYQQMLLDRMTHGGRSTVVPMRHSGPVYSASFSPDGRVVLTGSWDGLARLWDSQTGAPLGAPMRPDPVVGADSVVSACFVPPGDRILTSSQFTRQLWDAKTGALISNLKVSEQNPFYSFSPDGTYFLTSDEARKTWQRRDGKTGDPIGTAWEHDYQVRIYFSPKGDLVASCGPAGLFRLRDVKTGAMIGEPIQHGNPDGPTMASAIFSPDGGRLVTFGSGGGRIWDVKTQQPLGKPMADGNFYAGMFNRKGDRLVFASEGDDSARVWDAFTGEQIGERMPHKDYIRSASFSPQEDRILTGGQDHTARLWDAETHAPIAAPMQHEGSIRTASFSPQGECILSAGDSVTARIWNASAEIPTRSMQHGGQILRVAFSPQGDRVLIASEKGARLWDLKTGQPVGKLMPHERQVNAVAFSPLGDRLATASWDSTARIWDAQTGEPVGQVMPHQGPVRAVAFNSRGDVVVTGSDDCTATLWDAKSAKPLGIKMTHAKAVYAAKFSPDGTRVLTGSLDQTAQLWDTKTGEPVGEAMRHRNDVTCVDFSPEGDRLVTAGGHARLWNATTCAPMGAWMRHSYPIWDVVFSPQGDRVLTAATDNTARLWDARTGAARGEPMRHDNVVASVAFSPSGERVSTGSYDGTARIWDGQTGAPLGVPLTHKANVLQVVFSADGNQLLTACGDGVARLWNQQQLSEPKDFKTAIEVFTGHTAHQDGELRKLSPAEWDETWKQFRQVNRAWLDELVAHRKELRRQNAPQKP